MYLNVLDTGKASLSKFQSELRIPNVCKSNSNSNSNFKIEVRKFELRFTSLIINISVHIVTRQANRYIVAFHDWARLWLQCFAVMALPVIWWKSNIGCTGETPLP